MNNYHNSMNNNINHAHTNIKCYKKQREPYSINDKHLFVCILALSYVLAVCF